MKKKCDTHLIDGVLCLHLHVHGHKEGEKEEHTTGQGHQLTLQGKRSLSTKCTGCTPQDRLISSLDRASGH